MEAICVKMDERILKSMDSCIKDNYYSTRTDFIREAIRDKMKELEKEKAVKKMEEFFGSVKKRTTDEKFEKIREKIGKQYAKNSKEKLKDRPVRRKEKNKRKSKQRTS